MRYSFASFATYLLCEFKNKIMLTGNKSILLYIIIYLHYVHFLCFALDESFQFAKDVLEESHGKIIYSSVLFIRGEKTPQSQYPDLVFPPGSWKEGEGQLTKLGKQQCYNLGKWCRERYTEQLKTGYNRSYISVDSTVVDRTIMSAQTFLAGLLPPIKSELWDVDDLAWQPVPVRTREDRILDMIHGEKECSRYELEFVQMNKLPEIQALYRKHKDLFDYMKEYSITEWVFRDAPFYAIKKAWHLYNYFLGLKTLNISVPEWGDKIFPEPLSSVGALHYILLTYTPLMKRLEIGPLLKQMITQMKHRKQGSLLKQFHVYSTHTATFIGLLYTLGVYNNILPEPASAFLIELRKKQDEYIVTMTYKNSSVNPPVLLELPRCNKYCTLEQFSDKLHSLTPQDWDEECYISSIDKMSLIHQYLWLLIIVGSILIIAVLLCVLRLCRARTGYEQLR